MELRLLVLIVVGSLELSEADEERWTGPRERQDCLLELENGTVRGIVAFSRGGKRYCSYLGIPYAETPQRFEEAKLRRSLTGFLNANKAGPPCPQDSVLRFPFPPQIVGSEDCLSLNVHYPLDDQCEGESGKTSHSPLSVIFYVHGGGFDQGESTTQSPKYMMDECVVFLSLNYRLGALGFLSTEDEVISGNLGFKDLIVGLKWTQKNIKHFGGDPRSVTLMGFSAGAMMVNLLLTSPSGKDLFHRAIAMSSSALSPITIQKTPLKVARVLAKRLNCSSSVPQDALLSPRDIKKCLMEADVHDIVRNQGYTKWSVYPVVTYGPVVESGASANPFLDDLPIFRHISGDYVNKVPLLTGFIQDEGASLSAFPTLLDPQAVSDLNRKWNEVAPMSFYYDYDWIPEKARDVFSKKIRNFYFGNENVSMEGMQNLADLESDRFFVQGIMDTVELLSRHAPVYPYVFTFKGNQSFLNLFGYPRKIATHMDDVQFLFQTKPYKEIGQEDPEAEFSRKYIKLWLSFAKTGVPTATWPSQHLMRPYENDGVTPYNWYRIDEEITEVPNCLHQRRHFWKNLGILHYDSLLPPNPSL